MNHGARRWLGVIFVVAATFLAACNESDPNPVREPDASADASVTTTSTVPAPERPHAWERRTETFVDDSRPTTDADGAELAPHRTLVTDVYVPEGPGPYPLIVFAHGALGHPRKFTQLFESWAQAGYVVAAPAFPLSNDEADVFVLADVKEQPADVSFVMTHVLDMVDRADAERIGAAGLSLGGVTTYGVSFHECCRDERIDAVMIMSGARLPYEGGDYEFGERPFLIMHGTADPVIPFAEAEAAYAQMPAPKYFVTLEAGSHANPYENEPSPHDDVVTAVSLDFWDAFLGVDASAADRIVAHGTVTGVASAQAEP